MKIALGGSNVAFARPNPDALRYAPQIEHASNTEAQT